MARHPEGEKLCTPEMARRIMELLDDHEAGAVRRERVCEHCGQAIRAPLRYCSRACWENARTPPPLQRPRRTSGRVDRQPLARAEANAPGLVAFVRAHRHLRGREVREAVQERFGVRLALSGIYRVWEAMPLPETG